MTKRMFSLLVCFVALAASLPALSGLDLSAGPYLGIFNPSLKTFNDQVLLYEPRPALGSAAEYGLQVKGGIPLVGLGGGVNFGRWSNGDKWSALAGPGNRYTLATDYSITFYPLEAFADYSLPFVPMVLKGRIGGSLGMSWATFKYDELWTIATTGADTIHHYATAKGSTPYLGLNAGLDLVSIPKVTIGCDIGYRMGKVEQLTVKESHDPDEIGRIQQYYDHARSQILPLPLELNGLYARLVARYHF